MQIVKSLVLVLALLTLVAQSPAVLAQGASAKGTATVTYKGKLNAAIKLDAQQKAKANALDRYFSESNNGKAFNFDAIHAEFERNIDKYILDAKVINETVNEKDRIYTVVVRADLNLPRIENALNQSSRTGTAQDDEKSLITFVFVARQQVSNQVFKTRSYNKNAASDTETVSDEGRSKSKESERIRRSSVELGDSHSIQHTNTRSTSSESESGGSDIERSDVTEWSVMRTADLNSIMGGTFADAGYQVVEAETLGPESRGLIDVGNIRREYGYGDDLEPATFRNIMQGALAAGIPYVALGTLDVNVRDTDPATGLKRVYVTVSGKVTKVTGRASVTVSSVGPVQFAGTGPSEAVARTNALQLAAKSAAEQLMNNLNAKGVQ